MTTILGDIERNCIADLEDRCVLELPPQPANLLDRSMRGNWPGPVRSREHYVPEMVSDDGTSLLPFQFIISSHLTSPHLIKVGKKVPNREGVNDKPKFGSMVTTERVPFESQLPREAGRLLVAAKKPNNSTLGWRSGRPVPEKACFVPPRPELLNITAALAKTNAIN